MTRQTLQRQSPFGCKREGSDGAILVPWRVGAARGVRVGAARGMAAPLGLRLLPGGHLGGVNHSRAFCKLG